MIPCVVEATNTPKHNFFLFMASFCNYFKLTANDKNKNTEHIRRILLYPLPRFTYCGHFAPFPWSDECAHLLFLPLFAYVDVCIQNIYHVCIFYVRTCVVLSLLKVSYMAFSIPQCMFFLRIRILSCIQVNFKLMCFSNLPSVFCLTWALRGGCLS